MMTKFELPLENIFGDETSHSFRGIQKMLGFWRGRDLKKCLDMLEKLGDIDQWVRHVGVSASGYNIETVDSLPLEPLPSESVIVIFSSSGHIDRFEVLAGRLRCYDRHDFWPTYLWPTATGHRGDLALVSASLGANSDRIIRDVLRIMIFTPNKDIEVDS